MSEARCNELIERLEELLDGEHPADVGAALTIVMGEFLRMMKPHGEDRARAALAVYQKQIAELFDAP